MTSVDSISTKEYNKNNLISGFKQEKNRNKSPGFIKHQLHEKKIDEFFWTNAKAPHERFSALALLGSIIGVITPVLAFGKKQQPNIKLNSLKNIYQASKINYGVKEIVAVGAGGAIGGLAGGLLDTKERNKLNKIQEGTFQLMNITFPALLVGKAVEFCSKTPPLNNIGSKVIGSGLGMLAGAYGAVKLANKIDNKIFDKYNVEPDRKFEKKDFIVHVDDLVGTMVLAKIPFAQKLHVEKLLPAIYTWSGFSVGEK